MNIETKRKVDFLYETKTAKIYHDKLSSDLRGMIEKPPSASAHIIQLETIRGRVSLDKAEPSSWLYEEPAYRC